MCAAQPPPLPHWLGVGICRGNPMSWHDLNPHGTAMKARVRWWWWTHTRASSTQSFSPVGVSPLRRCCREVEWNSASSCHSNWATAPAMARPAAVARCEQKNDQLRPSSAHYFPLPSRRAPGTPGAERGGASKLQSDGAGSEDYEPTVELAQLLGVPQLASSLSANSV